MLESIIYLSPLIVLLSAILMLMFPEHTEDEQYGCFRFSRLMMLLAFLLSVIFYNKPLIASITQGSHFTLLFEGLLYLSGLSLLYLSRKWFASMNISGYVFCGGIFIALLFGSLLIRSENVLLSVICCIFMIIGNYVMLRAASAKRETSSSDMIYLVSAVFCILMMISALLVFYNYSADFDYSSVKEMLEKNLHSPILFGACAAVILTLMFMIGIAPLHFWFTETLGKTILPVFAYFMLVPVCAGWAGLIRINIEVFAPVSDSLHIFYKTVALSSVVIGALGACSGQNIRKILAYSTVYHWGIIFLVMQSFSLNAVNTGVIYMLVYFLATYGMCTCLFGIKVKGDYLSMLSEFAGAAYKRPYISAMMTVFVFSLLGLPPFLGFFGVFSALSYLAKHDSFYQFGFILLMMIVLSYAYLQIIKNLYFEKSEENFDRSDAGIYTAILLNCLLMIVIMLKPHYLMHDVAVMIASVFP